MTLGAESLEYSPHTSAPPGETLKETLEALGITQVDLARRTGFSTKHVNQIIQGSAVLTPETAEVLERVTGVPAALWNTLEAAWRTQAVREEENKKLRIHLDWLDKFPLAELVTRKILPDRSKSVENLRLLLNFFGVANPEVAEELWAGYRIAFRRSGNIEPNDYSVSVWLRQSVRAARKIECQPYRRHELIRLLPELRALCRRNPETWLTELPLLCARAGVAVVFLPALKGTHISGATRWLTTEKVLVALTDRHKKDDRFWFSFFHEIAHVLLHGKRLTFLDDDPMKYDEDPAEDEANRFAAEMLIPSKYSYDYERLRIRPKPFVKIEEFAAMVGISPGVVVGRLQHDGALPWSEGNGLKQGFKLTLDELR
ncbi:addiction module antidote protein, HigA family [Amycolatopsis xylanica]|uniref:Addiction module antidote protein, HigA family n=1 Tax=Amycolatopsis xylanica TaxID=589385 RepID=A0A1H3EDK5_9PSEU|nr:ImmA/IrrE family metallo-endopeptidase [Amycolatopsis xylanica]SDX76822.1 addiction module antidote protein, HigA family [Amycolatopsis xylanica]